MLNSGSEVQGDTMTSQVGGLPTGLVQIGVVHSPYRERAVTPIQSALNPTAVATIEIEERFADALDGLHEFDYGWVISWLGEHGVSGEGVSGEGVSAPPSLRQVPFLLQSRPQELGVLATRGPRRINPIGLSLVRIVSVSGSTIHFAGVDLVDETPVIDFKPFVARFDRPAGEPRCGWFDSVSFLEGSTPSNLAPPSG